MRIHVIRANSLPAALRQVRDAHGENAIVLDTDETPEGVTIRVGVEEAETIVPAPRALATNALDALASNTLASNAAAAGKVASAPPSPAGTPADTGETAFRSAFRSRPSRQPARISSAADRVAEALAWHGAPPLVTRSLLLAVEAQGAGVQRVGAQDVEEVEVALTAALEQVFRFGRPDGLATPLAFVGPPGSGKTATLAKLAAARSLAGADIAIINADLETAGARSRIGAFAKALGVEPYPAGAASGITSAIVAAGAGVVTLIDTSGRAPADADDIDELAEEIEAAGAGVLVLSAALAPAEAAELAECFAAAGAGALIMTQLDIARRIGALLAAADAGDLLIAGVSLGRKVGDGLIALTAESLARLILTPPRPLAKPKPRRALPQRGSYTPPPAPVRPSVRAPVRPPADPASGSELDDPSETAPSAASSPTHGAAA